MQGRSRWLHCLHAPVALARARTPSRPSSSPHAARPFLQGCWYPEIPAGASTAGPADAAKSPLGNTAGLPGTPPTAAGAAGAAAGNAGPNMNGMNPAMTGMGMMGMNAGGMMNPQMGPTPQQFQAMQQQRMMMMQMQYMQAQQMGLGLPGMRPPMMGAGDGFNPPSQHQLQDMTPEQRQQAMAAMQQHQQHQQQMQMQMQMQMMMMMQGMTPEQRQKYISAMQQGQQGPQQMLQAEPRDDQGVEVEPVQPVTAPEEAAPGPPQKPPAQESMISGTFFEAELGVKGGTGARAGAGGMDTADPGNLDELLRKLSMSPSDSQMSSNSTQAPVEENVVTVEKVGGEQEGVATSSGKGAEASDSKAEVARDGARGERGGGGQRGGIVGRGRGGASTGRGGGKGGGDRLAAKGGGRVGGDDDGWETVPVSRPVKSGSGKAVRGGMKAAGEGKNMHPRPRPGAM